MKIEYRKDEDSFLITVYKEGKIDKGYLVGADFLKSWLEVYDKDKLEDYHYVAWKLREEQMEETKVYSTIMDARGDIESTKEIKSDTLKIGDIVILKSGGPLMTIIGKYTHYSNTWELAWCTIRGEKQTAVYPQEALRNATDTELKKLENPLIHGRYALSDHEKRQWQEWMDKEKDSLR